MISEEIKIQKSIFTNSEITPFVFDMLCSLRDIKNTETVDSVYINAVNDKLEIYVFYEKENFDIENKIIKYLTDWEESYRYFPEIFVYPLDMIEDKKMSLPESAREV